MGCLMGYLGGKFDIVSQRLIEILANIPFLFVVMIINNRLEPEQRTIAVIVGIMCDLPGEIARLRCRQQVVRCWSVADYFPAHPAECDFNDCDAGSVQLCGDCDVADGAGLHPSWGRTLSDGVSNLDDPWIVSSVFGCMVVVLLLITFIGEAIREAFDPKKFTYYK